MIEGPAPFNTAARFSPLHAPQPLHAAKAFAGQNQLGYDTPKQFKD
jgi:hypothetical protein